MLTVIFIITGLALLFLGGVVVYSNPRSSINRWLGLFIGSGVLWLLANLLANLTTDPGLYLRFSRWATLGAAIIPLAFLMFCLNYAGRIGRVASGVGAKRSQRLLITLALPVVALIAMIPTPLNIKSASVQSQEIIPGLAYYLLLVIFVVYFVMGSYVLLGEYRVARQLKRQQLYYILLGTFLSLVPGLFISGILPLFGISKPAAYSPVVVVFFAAFTTLAIVRHKLLDVRFAIARAVAYLGSVLILALIYSVIFFVIFDRVLNLNISTLAQALLALSTGIAGLFFPIVRQRFDKLTNTLFYRDAYDPQELFAELNKTLVSSLDTKYLMNQSISIIETAIKPDYAAVGFSGVEDKYRIFSSRKLNFIENTLKPIRQATPHVHHKVIIADYLEDTAHGGLKKVMKDNNIAVIVRLTQDVRSTQEGLGYLILGNKRSGNPYTPQDVRTLETVANELIIAVQNALHYEEIQKFNEQLQARVDAATRKLRSTNEKLKALDETKDDFISMASHQLRTPLTSVKGYLSMVLEGDAGKLNDTQKKMLGQAFVSSQRMVFLIADLLNVSRLKTGKFVIEPAPTDLTHMIQEELDQLTETAEAREITIIYKKPKNFPQLMLDETKMRQVVMNFVDNAIYYTPAGGHIEIKLEEVAHGIELRVIDNGIGVPKHEQHHLFTKFYRAANARKARPDGTGLGLFMAKKVIVAQGGSLIFDSKEGVGSTFGFRFPHRTVVVTHQPVAAEPA